ncbi:MAG: DNA polymerase [Syntrophobacteraceae bacterium]
MRRRDRFWQFQDAHCNTPVQETAADVTKKAPTLLPQRVADTGAKIIGTVHDEIILEVPDRLTREAAVIL